jgi:pyruvate dehydrogenase E2 component (dihydrolipoamide acetyltransferase)
MAISLVMPALEMAQETGKLISWLKKEGDPVVKGEPLLEIETDKAVMEIESPADGVLAGLKAQAGEEVPVGRTIAWIVRPGEAPPTEDAAPESGRKVTTARASAPAPRAPLSATPGASQHLKISPKARRLANERGVDLSEVRGTGPGGEILASNILALAEPKAPAPVGSPRSMSAVSRLMAERTAESWKTVPHFFLTKEVNARALKEMRRNLGPEIEESHAVKLTHTDLLIAVVARVLAKHFRINASWIGEGIRENPEVNVGVAIAVDGGVVAPVIRNADKISLGEIAARRYDLAQRAHSGRLRPADLEDGTFTVSNLGMFGVDAFTAIIVPPQAAILAVGAITDRIVAVDGLPAVRPLMTLTLSSDHRVVDGARSAEFMRDLAQTFTDLNSAPG